MNPIIKIFMSREDMTKEEATEMYKEIRSEFMSTFDGDGILTPEDVLYEYGLDLDDAIFLM